MEISFYTRVALQVAVVVLGVLSIMYSYLGFVIGAIGAILLVNEIQTHYAERNDFKKKIVHELWTMGDMLVDIPIGNRDRIPYNGWSSKDASFQKDALGDDYDLWKQFYDSIDARNDFFASHDAFDIKDIVKLRQSCMENFSRLIDTSMIQQSALKEQFDNLVTNTKYRRILGLQT